MALGVGDALLMWIDFFINRSFALDWVVLVCACLLLLPRVVAVLLTRVLRRALASVPSISCSIGGLTFSRATELRCRLSSLDPFSKFCAALMREWGVEFSVDASVDEFAWRPTLSKPLSFCLTGVVVQGMVSDCKYPVPISQQHNEAEIETGRSIRNDGADSARGSIPELMNRVSSHIAVVSALSALPVSRFYAYLFQKLFMYLLHASSFSVSNASVRVVKGRSIGLVKLAFLSVCVERLGLASAAAQAGVLFTNATTSHQLIVRCGGFEVRIEKDYEMERQHYNEEYFMRACKSNMNAAFIPPYTSALFSTSAGSISLRVDKIPATSAPPLLTVEPLVISIDLLLESYVVQAIPRVELRATYFRFHVDPMRLFPALETMLAEFQCVLKRVVLWTTRASSDTLHLPCSRLYSIASVDHPYLQAIQKREALSRLLPRQIVIAIHRVSLTLYQRADYPLQFESSFPADVLTDLQGIHHSSSSITSEIPSSSSAQAAAFTPILRHLHITLAVIQVQTHIKSQPRPSHDFIDRIHSRAGLFSRANEDANNFIESIETSVAIGRGPQVSISDMSTEPLLSVYSCKFDSVLSAAPAVDVNRAISMGEYPSRLNRTGDGLTHFDDAKENMPESDWCWSISVLGLLHHLNQPNPITNHQLTVLLVTPHLNIQHCVRHWIEFATDMTSRIQVIWSLVPAIHKNSLVNEKPLDAPILTINPQNLPLFHDVEMEQINSPSSFSTQLRNSVNPNVPKSPHLLSLSDHSTQLKQHLQDVEPDDEEALDVLVVHHTQSIPHPVLVYGDRLCQATILSTLDDSERLQAKTQSQSTCSSDINGNFNSCLVATRQTRPRISIRQHLFLNVKLTSNAQVHLFSESAITVSSEAKDIQTASRLVSSSPLSHSVSSSPLVSSLKSSSLNIGTTSRDVDISRSIGSAIAQGLPLSPFVTLAIEEVTLKLEFEPYSYAKHRLAHTQTELQAKGSFAPLFSQRLIGYSRGNRELKVASRKVRRIASSAVHSHAMNSSARIKVDVSLSGFNIFLPLHSQQLRQKLHFSLHPAESIRQLGKVMSLKSAQIILEGSSSVIKLNADTLCLCYTEAILQVVPLVADLVVSLIPVHILPLNNDYSPQHCKSTEPFVPAAPGSFIPLVAPVLPPPILPTFPDDMYPVPILQLQGTVSDVTVDLLYLLECDSDVDFAATEFDLPSSLGPNSSNGPDDFEVRAITERTLQEIKSFNERTASKMTDKHAQNINVVAEDSVPSNMDNNHMSFSPPSTSANVSVHADSSNKRVALFSLLFQTINVDTYFPTKQWGLHISHTYGIHESVAFLSVEKLSLCGADRTSETVKSLAITAAGIECDLSPALFLGLYKFVKDCVAASINLKHELFHTDGLALTRFTGPVVAMINEVEYEHDPALSLLQPHKTSHVNEFRYWYHFARARYLSEPYMHITLHAEQIAIRACLNRAESLHAYLTVGEFASEMLPSDFTFKNVALDFLLHPLLYIDSIAMRRQGVELTPITCCFSEEQNFVMMDYLDLDVTVHNARVELAPQMDIGPLIEVILMKVRALLKAIQQLPSLNYLSRRTGGPGYVAGPNPPEPAINLMMFNCELAIIDSPMESFLVQLQPLWIQENMEQQHRLMKFKARMSDLKGPTKNALTDSLRMNEVSDMQSGLYDELNAFNSARYVAHVKEYKSRLPQGLTLKRARLLHATIASVAIKIALVGGLGSFYRQTTVLQLIQRRQLEELIAHPSALPHDGSVTEKTPFTIDKYKSLKDLVRSPVEFCSMSGRYFEVDITDITVRLRNYRLPLMECENVSVTGDVAVAFAANRYVPAHRESNPSSSCHMDDDVVVVSIGDAHNVTLSTRYHPLHVFMEAWTSVRGVNVNFSPQYVYALNDIGHAISKIVPPLPSLHSIQSVQLIHELSLSKTSESSYTEKCILPTNYLHALRGMFHSQMYIDVDTVSVCVVTSLDSTITSHQTKLTIDVDAINVVLNSVILRASIQNVNVGIVGRTLTKADHILHVPHLLACATIHWHCHDKPKNPRESIFQEENKPINDSILIGQIKSSGEPISRNETSFRHVTCGHNQDDINASSEVHLPSSSALFGSQQDRKISSQEQAVMGSASLINHPLSLSLPSSHSHVCSMLVSASIQLVPLVSQDGAPFAISVHSRTLAFLASFATCSSRLPLFTIPKRDLLMRYYQNYHKMRVARYVTDISARMDIKSASLILLEDNMNDLMIGMLARASIDFAIINDAFMQTSKCVYPTNSTRSHSLTPVHHAAFLRHLSILGETGHEGTLSTITPPHFMEYTLDNFDDCSFFRPVSAQPVAVVISGLYIEKISIAPLAVTLWEGADLGPARGVQISVRSIDLCAELQYEDTLDQVPSDVLKRSPFFIDLSTLLPSTKCIQSLSDSPNAPASTKISQIWSVANILFRLRKIRVSIVYNERWQTLQKGEESINTQLTQSDRVVVYTYENQRYTLGQGWSSRNLLPTDRPAWSNISGTAEILREKVELPSAEWEWETDWQLDFRLRKAGEVDEEGWEYAHDFPRRYSSVRTWYCNVRRRRWIKVRKLKTAKDNALNDKAETLKRSARGDNVHDFIASVHLVSIHQRPTLHDHHASDIDRSRRYFRHNQMRPDVSTYSFSQHSSPPVSESASANEEHHNRNDSILSNEDDSSGSTLRAFFGIQEPHAKTQTTASSDQVTKNASMFVSSPFEPVHKPRPAFLRVLTQINDPAEIQLSSSAHGKAPVTSNLPSALFEMSPSLSRFAPHSADDRRVLRQQSAQSVHSGPPQQQKKRPEMPSQHHVRVVKPKFLLSFETRSTLATLVNEYSNTLANIFSKDAEWLVHSRRLEHARLNRLRVQNRLEEEWALNEANSQNISESFNEPVSSANSTLSSPVSGLKRRASLPRLTVLGGASAELLPSSPLNVTSSSSSVATRRSRFASAENGAVRSTIASPTPFSKIALSLERDFSVMSALSMLPVPSFQSKPSLFNCTCPIDPKQCHSESQEWICLEIVNLQINFHSAETRGRLLFMVKRVSLYGQIDWLHSTHQLSVAQLRPERCMQLAEQDSGNIFMHSHAAHKQMMAYLGSIPFNTPGWAGDPGPYINETADTCASREASHADVKQNSWEHQTVLQVRDRFKACLGIEEMTAFVAPTDIDVDAGIIWMSKSTSGVLKSIMHSVTFIANANFRPELSSFTKREVEDSGLSFLHGNGEFATTHSTPVERKEAFSVNNKRDTYQPPLQSVKRAFDWHVPKSDSQDKALYPQPQHALQVLPEEMNLFELRLPELTFRLDAYQFSLLVDVLKTAAAPLPIVCDTVEDADGDLIKQKSLVSLRQEAMLLFMKIRAAAWEMRSIEHAINLNELDGGDSVMVTGAVVNSKHTAQVLTSPLANHRQVSSLQHNPIINRVEFPASQVPLANDIMSTDTVINSSFERFLSEMSRRIEYERQLSTVSSVPGHEVLRANFLRCLSQHNQLLQQFFIVLLAAKIKEKSNREIRLRLFSSVMGCERINYQMVKNEEPFCILHVDEPLLKFCAKADCSIDTSLEIKAVGGRNMSSVYQDIHSREYKWQEIITLNPFKSTSTESAQIGLNESDLMISAQLFLEFSGSHVIVSRCIVDLHPITILLTYESFSQIRNYFVTEQAHLQTQYKADRAKFLPLSQIVLDAPDNGNSKNNLVTPHSSQRGRSGFNIMQKAQDLAHKVRFTKTFGHSPSLSADTISTIPFSHSSVAIISTPSHSRSSKNTNGSGPSHERAAVWDPSSPSEPSFTERPLNLGFINTSSIPGTPLPLVTSTHQVGSGPPSSRHTIMNRQRTLHSLPENSPTVDHSQISFNYVRLGELLLVVSYRSGGLHKHKFEDVEGLTIKISALQFENKLWTLDEMFQHVKREMIKAALSQVPGTLGSFLAYKLGMKASVNADHSHSHSFIDNQDNEQSQAELSILNTNHSVHPSSASDSFKLLWSGHAHSSDNKKRRTSEADRLPPVPPPRPRMV